jgi:hypothetical protein
MFIFDGFFRVKQKPLNVITLGQRESDNINRMITISDPLRIQSGYLGPIHLVQFDHINRMLSLSEITFRSLHCKTFVYKQKNSFQINQNMF